MAEQLSQSQIDALLKKMSSGDVEVADEARKVREYDFKSPKKFTKEQLKALDSLHETFSRMLASFLSGIMRNVCEIEVVQIEEQRYYEYNNALPDNALIGLVNIKPVKYSEATLIMDLSTSMGYYMIDRLLGGAGTGYNLTRNYSEIELSILQNIFAKMITRLQDTWSNHVEMVANLESIETNSRLLQVFAPEDIVVIVIMNIKLGKLEGNLSICIPAEFLEEAIDSFSLKFARPSKKQNPEKEQIKRRIILENVCESNMELRAIFDTLQLSLYEIMQMQVDDVIPLSKRVDSDILITIDKTPWYTAKLGETKKNKAIRLKNIIT